MAIEGGDSLTESPPGFPGSAVPQKKRYSLSYRPPGHGPAPAAPLTPMPLPTPGYLHRKGAHYGISKVPNGGLKQWSPVGEVDAVLHRSLR
jgi:hypothetical protein